MTDLADRLLDQVRKHLESCVAECGAETPTPTTGGPPIESEISRDGEERYVDVFCTIEGQRVTIRAVVAAEESSDGYHPDPRIPGWPTKSQ